MGTLLWCQNAFYGLISSLSHVSHEMHFLLSYLGRLTLSQTHLHSGNGHSFSDCSEINVLISLS